MAFSNSCCPETGVQLSWEDDGAQTIQSASELPSAQLAQKAKTSTDCSDAAGEQLNYSFEFYFIKMNAPLSLVLAETAIEAVMAKGAVVLYNHYLKPKVAPHCVNMTVDEVSQPSLVILVLIIFFR